MTPRRRATRRRATASGPLKLLVVVPDLEIGGAEQYLLTLLPRLDPARFDPAVVCIGRAGALSAELHRVGVPVRSLGLSKSQAPLALLRLCAEMRQRRPDLVAVRGYNAEILGRLAAVLTRVPVIVTLMHNSQDIRPRSTPHQMSERLLNRFTDAVIGPAQAQVGYLVEQRGYAPHQVRIVSNGTELDFDVTGLPADLARDVGLVPGDPVIGTVCVMRPEKDLATLLAAFQEVLTAVPTAQLLIVGDGPERAAIEREAHERNLSEVRFTGARRDVTHLLRLMNVFVSTSRIECFPLSILEAMAAGLPVVATDVGGVPEIVQDSVTGHLAEPGDSQRIAALVSALLADPDRATRLGRAGGERVGSYFGVDRMVSETAAVLESLAGR